MPRVSEDDPPLRRSRTTSRAEQRLRVKKLILQLAWLDAPRAVVSGGVWTVGDRAALRAAVIGVDPVSPDALAKLVKQHGARIDRALVGQANRALLELLTSKKLAEEVRAQIEDFDRFRRSVEAALQQVSTLLDAAALPAARGERLALERHAVWLDSDDRRPSRSLSNAALQKLAAAGGALANSAAFVLAQRGKAPASSRATVAKSLRGWPLDLVVRARAAFGDALSTVAARLDPHAFSGTLAIAACVLPEAAWPRLLDALAMIDAHVDAAEQALAARRLRFSAVFERAVTAAQRTGPDTADMRSFAHAWRAQIVAEMARDGAPHARALPERTQPFDGLRDAVLWYIGNVDAFVPRGRGYLVERLRATAEACVQKAPRPTEHRLRDAFATLIITRVEMGEGGARFVEAAERLGEWLTHTSAVCAPGERGDDPLQLAHAVIAGALRGPPGDLLALLHHLGACGDLLLDRARAPAQTDSLAPNARAYLRGLSPYDAEPAAAWVLAHTPRGENLRGLLERGSIVDLASVLWRRPDRAAKVMSWLAGDLPIYQAMIVSHMGTLRRRVDRASDRALDDFMRCVSAMTRAHSSEATFAARVGLDLAAWCEDEDVLVAQPGLVRWIAEETFLALAGKRDDNAFVIATGNRGPIFDLAAAWKEAGHGAVDAMVKDRLRRAREAEKQGERVRYPHSGYELRLAAHLCEGDPQRLHASLARTHLDWGQAEAAWCGYTLAKKIAPARMTVAAYARDPQRLPIVYRALQSLGLVEKLMHVGDLSAIFATLDAVPGTLVAPEAVPRSSRAATRLLLHHTMIADGEPTLPNALTTVLGRVDAWKLELAHLERIAASTPSAQKRLVALRERLSDPRAVAASVEEDYGKALAKLTVHARWRAFDALIRRALSQHWRRLLGHVPKHVEQPDWQNALHLLLSVKLNRRLLKQLLRDRATGKLAVFRDHPVNQRFLERVAAKKVARPQGWLTPRTLVIEVQKQKLTAYVEQDPLRVLQMGNLFATCLSVGNTNAFSTIANAAEINKRVLMLRDEERNVVGRKLIALSDAGVVYGFRSYGSPLHHKASGGPWAKIAFDLLSVAIAHAAGARFPTRGEDEKATNEDKALVLFASWYNDGTERFDFWATECADAAGQVDRAKVRERLRAFFATMPGAASLDFDAAMRGLIWLGRDGSDDANALLAAGVFDVAMAAYVERHATSFTSARFAEDHGEKFSRA
ncbi:MAG: hypothetical protein IT381_12165 [Deltaproteobacteria bacterium]|nr:hypothetical protein [Deltaproteobacteria bacterium]